MANPTTKFVSVNLNKSYGHHSHQPQSQQNGRPSSSSSYSSGAHFGNGARGRAGGGGAGMVVLSRNRGSVTTAQKGGQRLSVPPPMNLPSLRKEHERFDPLSATGSSAGAGSSGLGSGHGASAMGWSKPGAFTEKDGGQDQMGLPRTSGDQRVGSPARPLSSGFSSRAVTAAEKAVVLKGEDFPSLHAAFTSPHKQKDAATASGQKQKPVFDDSSTEPSEKLDLITSIPMRPQLKSTRSTGPDHLGDDTGSGHPLESSEQSRKLDCFLPGPLPVVRLRHTFDWADDERDTSNRFPRTELGRSQTDYTDGRNIHGSEVGGISTSDILKAGSIGRDTLNSWRTPPQSRDGLGSRDRRTDRDGPSASPSYFLKDNDIESNRRGQPVYATSAWDGSVNSSQGLQHSRKDLGYVQNIHNNKNREPYTGRSFDQNWRDRNVDISINRYKRDVSQNNILSKLPVSSASKVSPLDDPILNFGRDRRSSNLVSYSDDSTFDNRDPFSDLNVISFKKKKDVLKQADFHDPVRESFEAELERVQRIQEEERRRIFEEQSRALTLARKEEEEREKIAKEEEERRRRLEEESREAAWRAEQERINAAKKAEEQRLAREEEKRKLAEEEERRKEAARLKLLELEAKIAKRQAEAAMKDSNPSIPADKNPVSVVKEGDTLRNGDVGEILEDGEQPMHTNRFFEPGSRLSSSRDVNSSFSGKNKQLNSWKNGTYDNHHNSTAFHDRGNGYYNHRQAASSAGRVFPRKGFYGGPAIGSGRPSSKDGASEPLLTLNEPHHSGGNRWSIEEDSDQYLKHAVHSDLIENDKFSDTAWEQSHPLGSPHSHKADSLFQNTDVERFSNLGRSRHLVRQPRVLPPPSFPSINRSSFNAASEYLDSSSHSDIQNQMTGKSSEFTEKLHDSGTGHWSEQSGMTSTSARYTTLPDLNEDDPHGCDSQSSVSVSSPPGSPTHLSNDDLDDCGDSAGLIVSANGKLNILSDCQHNLPTSDSGNINTIVNLGSFSQREEDEWTIENNEDLQEQQEYDEENSYEGEIDIHEGDGENLDVSQNFDNLHPDVDAQKDVSSASGYSERMEVLTASTDESGKSFLRDELNIEPQISTSDTRGEHGSFDELVCNELIPQKVCLEGSEDTSKIINETEKTLQNLVLEPMGGVAGDPLKDSKSGPSEVSPEHNTLSDTDIPMPLLGQSSSSSAPAVSSQTEPTPNLQFGLFSGPPLIPSPVPAIQIGSFQMPLHPHPHTKPSVPLVHSSLHSSHSPFFPIGQLRYASPITQGILSLNPQHMPFPRPSVPAHYSFNHMPSNALYDCAVSDPFIQNVQTNSMVSSISVGNQIKTAERTFDMLQQKVDSIKLDSFPDKKKTEASSHNGTGHPLYRKNETSTKSGPSMEIQGGHDGIFRNHSKSAGDNIKQKIVSNPETISSRFSSREKFVRRHAGSSGGRGKHYVYTIKNTGSKSFFPASEPSCELNAFQRSHQRNTRRAEFRVRQHDKRKLDESSSLSSTAQCEKQQLPNGRTPGISSRNGLKRETVSNKPVKSNLESNGSIKGVLSSENDCLQHKNAGKEESNRHLSSSCNSHPQEDIDAPLQNGVIQIFNQPGIETLSDEDDFIEVRSKRQMLYDRREQREKEIKAKSRALKANRKTRSIGQNNVTFSNSNKITLSPQGDESKRNPSTSVAHEFSSAFTSNMVSYPLPPIGTPPVNVNADVMSPPMKSGQKISGSVISGAGIIFEENNISSGSWNNGQINQQVMSLTQTQLDEAMKPVCFDAHEVSISDQTTVNLEHEETSASAVLPGKALSNSKTPLQSLLITEKIQFGAVTAPIFLPPVCRAFPGRIGSPLSAHRNAVSGEQLRVSENSHSLHFEKEKHHEESDVHLEDAEAEAAASAVAVAAISSDDVGNDGLGSSSNGQGFEGADDVNVLASKVANNIPEVTGQSAGEESLTVTLPADLSVETPLSVWPVLPNPHNSSSPILSHFPGAPPSHFPCFEMNPMLGGHIFAFGPHDELVGSQSQPQRSTTLGQGPIGTWPQSHSGVDSVYGPSASFAGPFISPPGGIPGIQGQPHMVFYNHFPPLAQFGLSYMGPTAYVPSGKQPDWDHNPVSTTVNVSEGDLSNISSDSNQHITQNMSSSLRNLGSGSSVVPLGSHLPMFDPSSFQASLDIPMQHRWPFPPPLHNISLSLLPHHPVDVANTSHASRNISADLSRGNNRPLESQPSVHSDGKSTFAVNSNAQLADELNLVNARTGNTVSDDSIQTKRPSYNFSSVNNNSGLNVAKSSSKNSDNSSCENVYKVTGSVNDRQSTVSSARSHVGPPSSSSSSQQYINPVGHTAKRGLVPSSQKIVATNEMHRRVGYQGRNRVSTAEKNFGSVKIKQIYVAKSTGAEPAASI